MLGFLEVSLLSWCFLGLSSARWEARVSVSPGVPSPQSQVHCLKPAGAGEPGGSCPRGGGGKPFTAQAAQPGPGSGPCSTSWEPLQDLLHGRGNRWQWELAGWHRGRQQLWVWTAASCGEVWGEEHRSWGKWLLRVGVTAYPCKCLLDTLPGPCKEVDLLIQSKTRLIIKLCWMATKTLNLIVCHLVNRDKKVYSTEAQWMQPVSGFFVSH